MSSPMTLMHFLDSFSVCYAAKSSEMCTNSLPSDGKKVGCRDICVVKNGNKF